jgi:hypothetical protein
MADDVLVSVRTIDEAGRKRLAHVFLPPATTEADIQTMLTAYAPILDAVVGGKIDTAFYQKGLTLPGGLKAGATALIDNRVGANFSYDNPSRFAFGVWIPGWLNSLFTGDLVSAGGAGVAALMNGYVTGFGGVQPTNGFSDDLTTLLTYKKAIRK